MLRITGLSVQWNAINNLLFLASDTPHQSVDEKAIANEDVLPIDLTFQRSISTGFHAPPPLPSAYICPICSEDQFTPDHFINHMTKHRWDKPLSLSQDRSWLLLTKSSIHKSSRRLKLLRRNRRRQRDLRRTSYSTTNSDFKESMTHPFGEEETFQCPACPAFQRIVGVKAAVVGFHRLHY